LREHFLHWLEALSLLGKLDDGVESVALLATLFVSIFLLVRTYPAERLLNFAAAGPGTSSSVLDS
jgi:hypothetical protein